MFKVFWEENYKPFQSRGLSAEKAREWAKELVLEGAFKVKVIKMTEHEIFEWEAERVFV